MAFDTGNAASGAAGGALAGSALGPWGAAAGGVIGGLWGGFSGGSSSDRYAEELKRRQAAQLGPAHNAGYSDFRKNQQRLIQNLEDQAAGRGPSVSREMLNQATNRNIATQNAMTAGGQGNQALAGMTAANNIGRLQADASQAAALGRTQEQANAQGMLGQQIWSGRSSDEDMNRFNASTNNNRQEFNAGNTQNYDRLRLAAMGMNTPSTGDQILSGGAQVRAWYDAQKANNQPKPAGV